MTYNIGQNLFKMDETIMRNSQNSSGSANNSPQFPSYLNQARLSTYYQDNPWPTLMFSENFGLVPPGGDINRTLTPGSRPGNLLPVQGQNQKPTSSTVVSQDVDIAVVNGFMLPKNMSRNFPRQ